MRKITIIVAAIITVFISSIVSASSSSPSLTPDQALQSLMEGNKRFVENKLTNNSRSDTAARQVLSTSQKPYAIILSCSDSRLPPEIIFDKGLGEIFVVRVAGNIPDPIVLGSIEYAAEHLGSPLIMVLGHERCGAVKASVEAQGTSSGSENIDAIINKIDPAIKTAITDCQSCKSDPDCSKNKTNELVECVVNINAKNVTATLTAQSKIIKHLVEENKIKIVTAKYDLDDGLVTLLD
jgi:carbonic anhydrase